MNDYHNHRRGFWKGKALLLGALLAGGTPGLSSAGVAQHGLNSSFGVGIPVGQALDRPNLTLKTARGSYEVRGDELLVRLRGTARLGQARGALEAMGFEIREVGRYSGILRIGVPGGESIFDAQRRMKGHPLVAAAWPNAIIEGDEDAGVPTEGIVDETKDAVDGAIEDTTGGVAIEDDDDDNVAQYREHQWALDSLRIDEGRALGESSLGGIRVAVLDTGAGYEYREENGVVYWQHPALSKTHFVDPYDAINGDEHANDDNHHGTHVVGLIAADGGRVEGAAQGVKIMPVKVLDANKVGTELSLVEGLFHAIQNGADIINLSLTFGVGYFPSPTLQEAIAVATAEGIVIVASTGNTSKVGVGYPAAFPDVIAVGATRLGQLLGLTYSFHSYYSAWGSQVDLLAPGGMIEGDLDLNGQPDGILGPAFPPGQPDVPEYWYFSGTSQAAPHITSLVAYLLADGVPPHLVKETLAEGAKAGCLSILNYYCGAGQPDLETLRLMPAVQEEDPEIAVNVTTWMETLDNGNVIGVAEVFAMSPEGKPLGDVKIAGSWLGSHLDPDVVGQAPKEGTLRFTTPEFDPLTDISLAFQVDRVWTGVELQPHTPVGFYSISPAMAESVALLTEDNEGLNPILLFELGVKESANPTPEVGAIARAYLMKNLGAGLPSGPLSIVVNPSMLRAIVGANLKKDDDLIFSAPLLSGVGLVPSLPLASAQSSDALFLSLPFDSALSTLDTNNFYPVLNASPADFALDNQTLGNQLVDSNLATNYPSSLWEGTFASASLGDGFMSSPLGSGFYSSTMGTYLGSGIPLDPDSTDLPPYAALGTGFFSSTAGAGFYSSTAGAGFYSSTAGAGFYSSTAGAGFYSSTIGAGFYSSTAGAGFYSSTAGVDYEAQMSGASQSKNKDDKEKDNQGDDQSQENQGQGQDKDDKDKDDKDKDDKDKDDKDKDDKDKDDKDKDDKDKDKQLNENQGQDKPSKDGAPIGSVDPESLIAVEELLPADLQGLPPSEWTTVEDSLEGVEEIIEDPVEAVDEIASDTTEIVEDVVTDTTDVIDDTLGFLF